MNSVADTGPINYLVQIDSISILNELFDTVWIPGSVERDLLHHSSPAKVRSWAISRPNWCEVIYLPLHMRRLGSNAGEAEAVTLASSLNAPAILLDDRAGRAAARRQTKAEVIGTIGLLHAASLYQIDPVQTFADSIARLRNTNYFFSSALEAFIRAKTDAHGN